MQDLNSEKSAHERVVRDYFAVTSSASLAAGTLDYAKSTLGLKRALGKWLNVDGMTVLDLGCGMGELCWLANQQGAKQVVGVNLSEGEIKIARQYVQAEFIHQDIESYLKTCPSESVDQIFALNILEHLSKDELVRILEHATRCLRDNGQLIAVVPNATSPFGAMTRYWDITHQLAFTPSSVRQLMRLCGFGRADFREWGPQPHGVVSGIRYLLWQGYRALIWFRLMVELASGKGGVYTADMIFRLTKLASK
jgi:cyclopropane fatty-acyl-phospholipid synthase-like methyltransferase